MLPITRLSTQKDISLYVPSSSTYPISWSDYPFYRLLNPVDTILIPLFEASIKAIQAPPTFDLQQQINQAKSGAIIKVPPGEYRAIHITQNITLQAEDPDNPPLIHRINARGISQLTLENLRVGQPELSTTQVRQKELGPAVRIVLSDQPANIKVNQLKISGVQDGISISSHHPLSSTPNHQIHVTNNDISNVRRDGIILKNVGQYTITGNTIHSIHPNYEPYSYESLGKESETAHAAVTLPNGIKADHADGIQVANGKGGLISGNHLSIGDGTWYQAVNVHHEADSPYKNREVSPVAIKNNTIKNNHDFAINVQHYGEIDAKRENNIMETAKTKNRETVIKMDIRKLNLDIAK